ncbi:hypothetical protein [Mycolicibacterium mageritense]|uniref:hypothetical protein n=1 Tax=Mycolicibacterium mageritense TaxID=53462 RepID=UPI001E5DC628|nr:hypothetical protein [Mycolicibacterium mageritense]
MLIIWAVWAWTAMFGPVARPLYGVWGGTPFEPFHYVPNVVARASYGLLPVLTMLALIALLVCGGLAGLRCRDFG